MFAQNKKAGRPATLCKNDVSVTRLFDLSVARDLHETCQGKPEQATELRLLLHSSLTGTLMRGNIFSFPPMQWWAIFTQVPYGRSLRDKMPNTIA